MQGIHDAVDDGPPRERCNQFFDVLWVFHVPIVSKERKNSLANMKQVGFVFGFPVLLERRKDEY